VVELTNIKISWWKNLESGIKRFKIFSSWNIQVFNFSCIYNSLIIIYHFIFVKINKHLVCTLNSKNFCFVFRVDKEDEMQCLIKGCNFVLTSLTNEVYEFRRDQNPQYVFHHLDPEDIYPYLLVNIGSGVSILQV